jgi:hypothetical protein
MNRACFVILITAVTVTCTPRVGAQYFRAGDTPTVLYLIDPMTLMIHRTAAGPAASIVRYPYHGQTTRSTSMLGMSGTF